MGSRSEPDVASAQKDRPASALTETDFGPICEFLGIAVECLIKDRQTLLMFFDLPADHRDHLRTSNPIESVFATVRHRTIRMKGALSQDTARLMVFKLVMAAFRTWRRLQGQNQLPKVVNGIKFKDGIEAVAEINSAA